MNLNVNLFSSASANSTSPDSSTNAGTGLSAPTGAGIIPCPGCTNDLPIAGAHADWETCPYCQKRLQIRFWPLPRQNTNVATALSGQATCFFHPDKAFQACCQRCGRFVCALCDLQIGKEHVCPACFERGRSDQAAAIGQAEWRYRDVLYDSIALTAGWAWILFWPVFVVALPAAIYLHVKYRKAPRSYLVPRAGWRFWVAYVGLAWLPILLVFSIVIPMIVARGRH